MFGLVVIVALVSAVIVGTVLSRRYRVGPPVLLIVLGAVLGLIPNFGNVHIDGEVVLLLFLPAILYWEGLNTSFREIRANARIIALLSVPLVIATAAAVSWTARALGMDPHAAGVLGAVLSPTDAAAVAGLAEEGAAPVAHRAESRESDQRRYRAGPVCRQRQRSQLAGPRSARSPKPSGLSCPISAVSRPGLLVGGFATLVRKRIDAPQEEGALSLLTPFAAFLLAQAFDCSGVVAVLVSALVLAYFRAGGDPGSFRLAARNRRAPRPRPRPRPHRCSRSLGGLAARPLPLAARRSVCEPGLRIRRLTNFRPRYRRDRTRQTGREGRFRRTGRSRPHQLRR